LPRGVGSDLHEALAWRWIAEGAHAQVDRERVEQEPSASVRVHARINSMRNRLALDGWLVVNAGAGSLDSVPIWVNQPNDLLDAWSFNDEAGGVALASAPIDETVRARLRFPKNGSARSLLTKIASQTAKTIHFHGECAWNSQGSIPLVAVPGDYLFRGMILVETPQEMRSQLKSVGLRRLDPASVEQPLLPRDRDAATGVWDERSASRRTVAAALAYDEPGCQLELVTEPLSPLHAKGIIREALLTTVVDPRGTTVNRLRLLVHAGIERSLDLVTRANMSLVRIRRDGAEVVPSRSRSGASIPLLGSNQGPRSSTIVIDYTTEGLHTADGARLWPHVPAVSLPCLSFDWEVVTSPPWRAVDSGSRWIASDREDVEEWPYAALGIWKPAWNFHFAQPGQDREWLRILDDRLTTSVSGEMTFAEWFSRWDAGPWPVVIDRVSLNLAGLGPKSRCVPSRAKAEQRSVSLATAEQHGLAIVRFPHALLITSQTDAPKFEPRDRWAEAVIEALVWGSDRTDRFETLPRWRGEVSPRLASTARDEIAERIKLPRGWLAWRFGGATWPGDDSFVYLIDARARIVSGWIIVALCLVLWFPCRGRLTGRRFLVLGFVMLGSLLINWLLPSRNASYTAAMFIGMFVILMLELGERIAQDSVTGRTGARSGSSLVRRTAGATVGLTLMTVLLNGLASAQPPFELEGGSPILALFPYEGAFDPTREVKEVILRLADFTRLSRRASSGVGRAESLVRAVSAVHRVARRTVTDIVVDTEMELVAVGQGPFTWRIPVASARDIEATLDGERVPISVEPGGRRGALAISRAGKHMLRVHRLAAARTEGDFESLSLPVNALASARVLVLRGNDGEQPGQPSSASSSRIEPEEFPAGLLGPADRIEIRWPKPRPASPKRASGTMEGLILWDINPAGDRVRARFTVHQPEEMSAIRFAHEPGLILRSGRAAGESEAIWQEDARKHEWTLRAGSPIAAGSTIELDCWLPADARGSQADKPPKATDLTGGSLRRLPRIQPKGVDRYSGSIGVRRPGDWTGRLEGGADTDLISDESFVKSWGSLPAEPLTFCGTTRFVREARASMLTGPQPIRFAVKPTVQIQLESGRVVLTVLAELSEQSGPLRELEAQLPDGIRVTEVSADGLVDWTITPKRGLRLLFGRQLPRARRLLRIAAWMPFAEDPLKIGSRQHRLQVPWIKWGGMEETGGLLTISSVSKPELAGSTGLTFVSAESPRPGGATPQPHRLTYRLEDARKLGEIVWESIPARVSVLIESQMTIHPDSAEWVAVLRYDVVGGALDVIHLRMPTVWAAGAVLHLTGSKYQLTTETRGPSAYWTITPERPIWGSQRFVLRSTRLLGADREIAHPEISPLGRGGVDAFLGIVNATGRPPATEIAVGLDKISYATRFQAREFASDFGTAVSAYRATREGWSLRVPLPRNLGRANDSQDGSARVALADVTVVATPGESSIGRAVYETVAESGSSLSFALARGCSLLWATVDGIPVTPFQSSSGRWTIALDDRRPARVGLIWKTEGTVSSASRRLGSVALPRAGSGPAPTLVTVYTPPQIGIQGDFGGLEPTTMARVEMVRAEWIASSISDLVAKFDRSSGRDHERLVLLLLSQEMALRSAARSDQRGDLQAKPRTLRAGPSPEKIRAARTASVETARRAGLEADLASVQDYLGESRTDLAGPLVPVPEPTTPDRIRLFGRPFTLIGAMPGIDEPASRPSLTFENRAWAALVSRPPVRLIVALILTVGIALLTTRIRGGRWITSLALAMATLIAYSLGGPTIAVGSLALAGVGWGRARG
jgi:hypothetical protein